MRHISQVTSVSSAQQGTKNSRIVHLRDTNVFSSPLFVWLTLIVLHFLAVFWPSRHIIQDVYGGSKLYMAVFSI